MESAFLLFNMWSQAVTKAGSTDVSAVSAAIVGQKVVSPTGYEVVMNENHHLSKPVMLGEVRADGQFNVVFQSKPIAPQPWSPYLPENKLKLSANN
jgi:branched-chain amino acid transport system substrate-binding protein/urea transport system substrate-binding protein